MITKEQAAGEKAVAERAGALFFTFRNAYAAEWRRLEDCERMYRGDHWHGVPVKDRNEPRPVTPILQSTVENVAADLMEQTPRAVIRPESAADGRIAAVVEAVIRRNHDEGAYAVEYQRLVHDLLVGGYCVQEVGYDTTLNNGLGGAFIRQAEPRGILFDPLVTDIQKGRAVFKYTLVTRQWLREHYPEKAALVESDPILAACAPRDDVLLLDRGEAVLLLEYWWRTFDRQTQRSAVHMALIAGGIVLEDSRLVKPEGYYAHGQYPFILTPLFPRKGSVLGFGLVDLFKTQQLYADKLDQIVLKNAVMASHNKLLVTDASGFDPDDLRDWSKDVHRGESLNGVTWFSTPPLPAYLISYIDRIRESIKEESGANESSRGNTARGVTAASAINALQLASTKRARMATTQLHEAFRRAVRLEIETEREFNYYRRPVTVTENGRSVETVFDTAALYAGRGDRRTPVEFFISVQAEKQNRYQAAANNEILFKLIETGAIAAADAVGLMDFDGREQVEQKIRAREDCTDAGDMRLMTPGERPKAGRRQKPGRAGSGPKGAPGILKIFGGKR